jgi:signal transduction histidine kinase
MMLIIVSNLLFINNVVEPVAVVTESAKRISAGSYGFQIENKYSDELGELVDNINDMSMKIGQNEKMKSEFISSVSHELRTPLTAINGWGETILEDPTGDSAQIRRGVRIILNESRRLSTMVEELLDFSKMEDGRFTLRIEQVDLQAELEDAIFTYRELFRQEGIELEYEPLEDLMPEISGDAERLKQVFCNVLDNASKHGGAGKRIVVSISREDREQVVRVRDYGPGVPEAELPFVKQKFYKGSSKARGSGIGLAVCDEILQLHGGTFEIGNAEGGGAVVTIRLPENNH